MPCHWDTELVTTEPRTGHLPYLGAWFALGPSEVQSRGGFALTRASSGPREDPSKVFTWAHTLGKVVNWAILTQTGLKRKKNLITTKSVYDMRRKRPHNSTQGASPEPPHTVRKTLPSLSPKSTDEREVGTSSHAFTGQRKLPLRAHVGALGTERQPSRRDSEDWP